MSDLIGFIVVLSIAAVAWTIGMALFWVFVILAVLLVIAWGTWEVWCMLDDEARQERDNFKRYYDGEITWEEYKRKAEHSKPSP